jgi:hypothetical protein
LQSGAVVEVGGAEVTDGAAVSGGGVAEPIPSGVSVAVGASVDAPGLGDEVPLGVPDGVCVRLGVRVGERVAVRVAGGGAVLEGVDVGVEVNVGVTVAVGEGVSVGVDVVVKVAVPVEVAVVVEVAVTVDVGVSVGGGAVIVGGVNPVDGVAAGGREAAGVGSEAIRPSSAAISRRVGKSTGGRAPPKAASLATIRAPNVTPQTPSITTSPRTSVFQQEFADERRLPLPLLRLMSNPQTLHTIIRAACSGEP